MREHDAPRSITESHIIPRTDSTSGLQQRIKELEAECDALLTENAKFRNELVELDHCRDSARETAVNNSRAALAKWQAMKDAAK